MSSQLTEGHISEWTCQGFGSSTTVSNTSVSDLCKVRVFCIFVGSHETNGRSMIPSTSSYFQCVFSMCFRWIQFEVVGQFVAPIWVDLLGRQWCEGLRRCGWTGGWESRWSQLFLEGWTSPWLYHMSGWRADGCWLTPLASALRVAVVGAAVLQGYHLNVGVTDRCRFKSPGFLKCWFENSAVKRAGDTFGSPLEFVDRSLLGGSSRQLSGL